MKKGFSLLEILVAFAVLGAGLVVLFNIFPLALQSVAYSRRVNEVAFLAEKKLEEAKAMPLGSLSADYQGQENGMRWSMRVLPQTLGGTVPVRLLELEIGFDWQGKSLSEKFITYR